MEVDFNLGDLEPIKLNLNTPSYDFDNSVELLMNTKSNEKPIQMSSIQDLEKELNDLTSSSLGETKTVNSWFNSGSILDNTDSNIGQATKESVQGNTKTWDGFIKVSEVPEMKHIPTQPNLSDRDRRRKKKMMIKKLEEWYERGHIKNMTRFDMDSSYEEVEDEYETAIEDKRKKDSLKLQGWWLKTLVNTVEFGNSTFDPFGIDISGLGEQVEEDLDSYEEIFGELYEKYKGGKMAPELALLLKVGVTAATVSFTNKALSSAAPGFNDVIKQSPELMKMFTNATVESMSQKSPGFAFASNILNTPEKVNTTYGPPPAPIETKTQAPPRRPGTMEFTERPNPQRPDISQARGTMFREKGVELNNFGQADEKQEKSFRPEMKGPSEDIDNFLSALKPSRSVNIHDEDSMLSISSLKDLQNTKMPRSSKKRVKSEKNIVSLDI